MSALQPFTPDPEPFAIYAASGAPFALTLMAAADVPAWLVAAGQGSRAVPLAGTAWEAAASAADLPTLAAFLSARAAPGE